MATSNIKCILDSDIYKVWEIVLDIDKGLSVAQAVEILQDYKFILYTYTLPSLLLKAIYCT